MENLIIWIAVIVSYGLLVGTILGIVPFWVMIIIALIIILVGSYATYRMMSDGLELIGIVYKGITRIK